MIKLKMILTGLVLFSVMACKRNNTNRYPATAACHNLTLTVSLLHPQERVALLYDTRLLLRHRVDSLHDIDFNSNFCIKYRNKGTLRVIITANKQSIIDTSMIIDKPLSGYKLAINRTSATVALTADTFAGNP
jgi:hypothetical protein